MRKIVVTRLAVSPTSVHGTLSSFISSCGPDSAPARRIKCITATNSNVTRIAKLPNYVTGRLLAFRSNALNLTFGLSTHRVNIIVLNSFTKVRRNRRIHHANRILSIPINSNCLNHIISPLNGPVSNLNRVRGVRNQHVLRTRTPSIVRHRPISRPLSANLGTVSTVAPVNHNRHRLVVNSHRANGATVTVSAVVGRGTG